jgi:hypothetical protein
MWMQQQKLVGTGATGSAEQGISVALSANANTAVVGGFSAAIWPLPPDRASR